MPLRGIGGIEGGLLEPHQLSGLSRKRRHKRMTDSFGKLGEAAEMEVKSLQALISHLEDQSARLVSTPSIAPTKGWITSAFYAAYLISVPGLPLEHGENQQLQTSSFELRIEHGVLHTSRRDIS